MNTVSGFRWFFTVAAVAAVFMGGAERVSGAGATAVIEVQANQPGPAISPDLYGIFFEEINCAGDGGLYAELVRNRSFEEPGRTSYWQQVTTGFATGSISADASKPLSARNVWSLKLTQTSGGGSVGAANPGFWGMHLKAGEVYDVSLYARGAEGFTGPVVVRLENRDSSQVLSQVALGPVQAEWTHFKGELVPSATVTDGRLVVALLQPGTVWVDVVSLF
ncbi:MAG TPA: carbohydrate binding domain-containing protein, partial [Verrucomicrobiota bacterium]|nr:carbohydrate binding domain-containing protein [Verrucomicrobiota bacterium]